MFFHKRTQLVLFLLGFFMIVPSSYAIHRLSWGNTKELLRIELWNMGLEEFQVRKKKIHRNQNLILEIKKPLNSLVQ